MWLQRVETTRQLDGLHEQALASRIRREINARP